MNKTIVSTACLLTALAGSAQAQEFPVSGSDAEGLLGQRVWVDLLYDYGVGFAVIAEDLQFEYQFAGISFVMDGSTIGPLGDSGAALAVPVRFL